MTIGEKIKTLRRKKRLTQKQLGDLCGMADSAIRRYESGRAKPKIETIEKIANALGVPLNKLIDDAIIIPIVEPTRETLRARESEEKELSFLNKMDFFREKLNYKGQDKAIEQVELLTKIPEYQKKNPQEYTPILNAAHERTDISYTDEDRLADEDMLD